MMASGELQAGFTGPAGIGRAGPPTGGWEQGGQTPVQNYPELIANAAKAETDWYRRTGIYPIHGTVVVKTDVLDKNPWIGRALFDAFTKAKAPYLERLKRGEGQTPTDVRYRTLTPLLGDPLPYGIKANRASIEALMSYALQQKLIPAAMPLGQAFFDPEA
jgi:4,5-dihydroxyphthalate decarboxylase